MKILISADIEGINGVVHPDQIYPEGKFYKETLDKWVLELSAICDGLKEAGVKEIVINDSHNHMRNLDSSRLKNISLISGWQKPFSMMNSIDSGFHGCMFTGYHGMAGSSGVLSHTYRPRIVKNVFINNIEVGEIGLNAALAGFYNVPVIFLSGDDVTCNEGKKLLGEKLTTVETKKALSRFSACSRPFSEVLEDLKLEVKTSIKNLKNIKPYKVVSPTTLKVTFYETNHADGAELIPGVKRLNNHEVEFIHENFPTIFKCFLAMGGLAKLRDEVQL